MKYTVDNNSDESVWGVTVSITHPCGLTNQGILKVDKDIPKRWVRPHYRKQLEMLSKHYNMVLPLDTIADACVTASGAESG